MPKPETPYIPNGILSLAAGRRDSTLRELQERHTSIQAQVSRPPMFADASWQTQRDNLHQALSECEQEMGRLTALSQWEMVQRFCPEWIAEQEAREAVNAPAHLSHEEIEQRNFMQRWNLRRQLDPAERIIVGPENG